MKWQDKAKVMRLCATLPLGKSVYKWGQRRIGRLQAEPMRRLPYQREMLSWLLMHGDVVQGATLFEVGTGHIPIVPIGFFLSGADRIITVDLHRRIDWRLTQKALMWIASNYTIVKDLYRELLVDSDFDQRFALLERLQTKPRVFLEEARIEYLAPMDAAHTALPSASVDLHFSVTTLEHIPYSVLVEIFQEAKRILKPTGHALHFIDLSDHFQHQDKSISKINFLQFTDEEWNQIAGNEFAYCNRLRSRDYHQLFTDLSYQVLRYETSVDVEATELLQSGFVLDKHFHSYTPEETCTVAVRAMLMNSRGM